MRAESFGVHPDLSAQYGFWRSTPVYQVMNAENLGIEFASLTRDFEIPFAVVEPPEFDDFFFEEVFLVTRFILGELFFLFFCFVRFLFACPFFEFFLFFFFEDDFARFSSTVSGKTSSPLFVNPTSCTSLPASLVLFAISPTRRF